jgi:hypothetical protein
LPGYRRVQEVCSHSFLRVFLAHLQMAIKRKSNLEAADNVGFNTDDLTFNALTVAGLGIGAGTVVAGAAAVALLPSQLRCSPQLQHPVASFMQVSVKQKVSPSFPG